MILQNSRRTAAHYKGHHWWANRNWVNLGGEVTTKSGRPCLVKGVYSNTVRTGRLLEIVQAILPGAGVT